MTTVPTVPLQKYRRLKVVTFVLLGVSVFLGIALFAQSTNATETLEAQASTDETAAAAAVPSYVRNDAADPMAIGDIDAPIVLSEWTDMRCPFCAVFNRDTLPAIVQEYVDAGKVRIEVNDVAFFGDDSAKAAVAVRAAGNQGKYAEYLAALYEAAPEEGHPDMPNEKLMGFAEAAGVEDLDRFAQDLEDPELLAAVQQSTAAAQQLGVNSVPFFVVNGTAISGAQPIENFRTFLDEQLEQVGE